MRTLNLDGDSNLTDARLQALLAEQMRALASWATRLRG
ncbi:MAG: hypothetical protein RIR00_578 [Pseudomonadota bacterium]|jgi:hypothetical protein